MGEGAKFRPKDPGTSRQNEIEQTETKHCEPSYVHTGHIGTEETGSNQTVLLQTAKAYVTAPGNFETEMAVRVSIDGGSQRTYIGKDLRNKLKLPTFKTEQLVINTFGTNESEIKQYDLVKFVMKSKDKTFEIETNALVQETICSPLQGQEVKFAAKEHYAAHLFDLGLSDESPGPQAEINILYWGGCYAENPDRGSETGGEAKRASSFGNTLRYVLSGPISDVPRSKLSSVNLNATHVLRCASVPAKPSESLETQVKRFWDLYSVGIMETDTVNETFKETITFDDGRYTVELPFQEFHPVLPDNFRQQPLVLEQYDEIITKQLHDGIIEEINPHNDSREPEKIHYLPHHPVIREHAKTTKVRIVYDASAKVRNDVPSLNQCLKTGPSLIPTIFDILLRFRWNRVAVTADIKSAFLMINVSVNSKPNHPPRAIFLMGEFPTPGQKRSLKPAHLGPIKTS